MNNLDNSSHSSDNSSITNEKCQNDFDEPQNCMKSVNKNQENMFSTIANESIQENYQAVETMKEQSELFDGINKQNNEYINNFIKNKTKQGCECDIGLCNLI